MNSEDVVRRREERFLAIYDAAYADLLRFVRRRVREGAEDIVNDVMLTAWRRLDVVPTDMADARAWLFGVARKVMLNAGRRERKQEALPALIVNVSPGTAQTESADDVVAARIDVAAAWQRLSLIHQEALTLAVLDGLNAPEAAAVLGISSTAFRLRLSRARRSLHRLIDPSTSARSRLESRPHVRSSR
ncbi:RNA polymerase sigma factor [Aeromicrobium sp.]|uniref:RNA polymerase sigma factor n=1 Tax=Aeromicrobium sp. TaxID=1871063 RepID=UPI004034E810